MPSKVVIGSFDKRRNELSVVGLVIHLGVDTDIIVCGML